MAKILIVDDELHNRKLIRTFLSQFNDHEFFEAIEGHTGLYMMRTTKPDLVILDIVMAPVDGIEFIKNARKEPALSKIPILVLTGHLDARIMKDSKDAGCDDFIYKPIKQPELERAVSRILLRAKEEASASSKIPRS